MSHVANNQEAVRNAIIFHMHLEMVFEWLNHFFKLLTKKAKPRISGTSFKEGDRALRLTSTIKIQDES